MPRRRNFALPGPSYHQIPPSATLEQHLAALQAFVRSQKNPLLDRLAFFSRSQESGESFDEYLACLKELYTACDFARKSSCNKCVQTDDETLRDKLVVGIKDDSLRHKLLAEEDLTLEKAVVLARAEEAARLTKSGLGSGTAVSVVRKSSYEKRQRPEEK